MKLFPLFLKLEGRRCVVIGGGRIAAAKAVSLLRQGAQVTVVAPSTTAWLQARHRAGKLVWQKREFRSADVKRASLVIAATDSPAANHAVFRACRRAGVWCNVVDDPEHCDFFYAAVVHRGPLQIAISTGASSPALARRLRKELQQQFGPEYRKWVEQVGRARRQILLQPLAENVRRRLLNEIASREAFDAFTQRRRSTPRTS